MALISEARVRVLAICSMLVAVAAVVAAALVWSRTDDEPDAAPKLRKAVVVDDLCAVVAPLVPASSSWATESPPTTAVTARSARPV